MSLLGPIAETERCGLQISAANVLADPLTEAAKAGLPSIGWTVRDARRLVGRVLPSFDPGADRAAFDRSFPGGLR